MSPLKLTITTAVLATLGGIALSGLICVLMPKPKQQPPAPVPVTGPLAMAPAVHGVRCTHGTKWPRCYTTTNGEPDAHP